MSNNMLLLILIAVVGFLLYCMNKPTKENMSQDDSKNNTLENIVSSKVAPLNSKLIDTIGQKLADSANNNLGSVLPPKSDKSQTMSETMDIFKDQQPYDGVPMPRADRFNGASLNSSGTFNFDGLNNSVNSNLNSGDLLPVDNDVNEYNINKPPVSYFDANLTVNTTEKIGVDTQGSSKKNASQDLRGNVPCPKFVVSPWNNSTIDPDTNLKGMYA